MAFVEFHDLFPALAEAETRTAYLAEDEFLPGLPKGDYAFVELFCNEPGCDCRRVYFEVYSTARKGALASVSWGWESREFYAKWLSHVPSDEADEMARQMKGPCLAPGAPQSELAPSLLQLIEEVLLVDEDYVKRVKRHYGLFRRGIDSPLTGINSRSPRIIQILKARKKERSRKRKKGGRH